MKILFIFGVVGLLILLGIGIYFFLPQETITIIELPPIKQPAIVIP
jgi:hypothetical protein